MVGRFVSRDRQPFLTLDDLSVILNDMSTARTTIQLDRAVLADAKKFAAETGRTLGAVIEEALMEVIPRSKRPKRNGKRKRITLPDYDLGRLRPGISLERNASIESVFDKLYVEKLQRMSGEPNGSH